MALKSALLSGDPALEAAAVRDSAHILPGARGAHVKTIQIALNQVADARLQADGIYGPATANAVAQFKRKRNPPILNFAGQIDNIVGIKTLAALDSLLPQAGGGGLNLNFDVVVTTLHIVVNFFGANGTGPADPDDAIPAGLLSNYEPVDVSVNLPDKPKQFMRHKVSKSLLLRITRRTNAFGGPGFRNMFDVIDQIDRIFKAGDPEKGNIMVMGKVCVIGTSSGARVVYDFISVFQPLFQTVPHFIASIDAPFFQIDTSDRPTSTGRPAVPDPTLRLTALARGIAGMVPLARRLNMFQNEGNHAERVLQLSNEEFLNLIYTSSINGEVHGNIEGMNNKLMPVTGATDDQRHENFDPIGRRKAQELIAAELQPG